MPGPGGGSRGGGGGFGGGSRGGGFGGGGFGGSRGGGFGGGPRPGGMGGGPRPGGMGGPRPGGMGGPRPGGFGGPHHRPHHHGPYFGPMWHRPRYYGGGGGGGCFGALMAPFIIGIFFLFAIVYMLMPVGNVTVTTDDFGENYDEAAFQQAADEKYAEFFKADSTYEDNILLYFLVEEECEDIFFIAWVGDNIKYEVSEHLGNNYTTLGQLVNTHVANYYAYSLDSNLASLVAELEKVVVSMDLDSSFAREPATKASPSESKLVDLTYRTSDNGIIETEPKLTAETVNAALASFTEATGIRTVICVDYIDNVFTPTAKISGSMVFMIVAIVILVVVVVVVSVNSNKNRKKKE